VKSLAHHHGDEAKLQEYLNNFWKPSLTLIGLDGLPSIEKCGNTIYKELACKCCMRLPPTLRGEEASKIVLDKLLHESEGTFGAHIDVNVTGFANGLDCPKLPENIETSFFEAHNVIQNFNKYLGCL